MRQRVEDAAARARAGRADASTITIERPDTQIRGPGGQVSTLPRKAGDGAVLVVHRKVNGGRRGGPRGGQRSGGGGGGSAGRPRTLSFGALAVSAIISYRVFGLVRRALFPGRRRGADQPPPEVLEAQQRLALLQGEAPPLPPPPVRGFPAMLARALPQLGPPRRVKRLAQAQRERARRVPSAQQMTQTRGAVQRKPSKLQAWDAAVRREQARQQQALVVAGAAAGALGAPPAQQQLQLLQQQQQRQLLAGPAQAQQQQQGRGQQLAGACAAHAAAAAAGGPASPPQPLLEVASGGRATTEER